jgi:hypothetical protein
VPDTVTANLAFKQTADPNRDVDALMDGREEIAHNVRIRVRIAENAIRVRRAAYVGFYLC